MDASVLGPDGTQKPVHSGSYVVQQGQFAGQPGYGSAIAVILFFISLTIALGYQRLALRRDLAGSVTRGVR